LRVAIKVQPRSSRPGVEAAGEGSYRVRVRSIPEDGKANAEAIELLAEFLGVPRSRLRIVQGASSRTKIIDIAP
jgi:uncharacterized protein